VPCNIAEGQARNPRVSLSSFWGTPRGSLVEVEAQILIARELGYGGHDESQNWLAVTAEVGRILNRLLCSLPKRNSIPG
jgi:four helix bundle protein